jgi:hypothetical protein
MPRPRNKPVLIGKVDLWWYGIAILPILLCVYLGFTGTLSPLIGLMGLFAFFFWLFSFIGAIWSKLKKRPKDTPQ